MNFQIFYGTVRGTDTIAYEAGLEMDHVSNA